MSGTVKSVFQGLAGLAIGLGMMLIFALLGIAFFRGLTWFTATFLPWAFTASIWAFGICVFVLLPLAIFRATRGWSGLGFMVASYVFGFLCWLLGFIVTTETLGAFWTLIGLFFLGFGVVPLALVGTVLKGFWPLFWMVIVTGILTFGTRAFGAVLITSSDRS